jgi:hypothetical protein
MPAVSEATAQPRRRARTQTPVLRERFSIRENGATLAPPPRLAPSLRASEAFEEGPDEAGGVTTEKGGALEHPQRHRVDTSGQDSTRACAHLWGQSETLTGHPRRSPRWGCQPHARRAQCAAKRAASTPTQRRPVSRPAAWPGTGLPCSGARSPSTMAPPPPLSLQTKYPQTQRGTSSPHPTRTSHAEVSSPRRAIQSDGSMAADRRATSGHASLINESGYTTVTPNGKQAL